MTRPGGLVGYQAPGGRGVNSEDAGRRLAEYEEGAGVEVEAECGLWVRVATSAGAAWVEMDAFMAG